MSAYSPSYLARHANSIVPVMASLGYTLEDLVPAYGGQKVSYIDQVLRDNVLALSRPVIPYGLLGIHEASSAYFNVSQHGFRWVEDNQPWPPRSDSTNIFFFGGSTALGYNVEDRHSIPFFLNDQLKKSKRTAKVYNFASGSYTSRQEALRFLDILDRGHVPDIAIFLDGFNDSFYAYGNPALLNMLDGLYQSEKRRRRAPFWKAVIDYAREARAVRRQPLPGVATYTLQTPDPDIAQLASREGIDAALSDTVIPSDLHKIPIGLQAMAQKVWSYYLDSVAIIQAAASRHNVQTVFAWQPVPLISTHPKARIMEKLFHAFPASVFCSAIYKWLSLTSFPGLPENACFMDLSRAGEGLQEISYVDLCHYNGFFAEKIAEKIFHNIQPVLGHR